MGQYVCEDSVLSVTSKEAVYSTLKRNYAMTFLHMALKLAEDIMIVHQYVSTAVISLVVYIIYHMTSNLENILLT